MADIVTSKVWVDGEKGVTATKMNQIIGGSVIQPAFYSAKPVSSTVDPGDQFLELKSTGSYARITGQQLIDSISSQLTVPPLMRLQIHDDMSYPIPSAPVTASGQLTHGPLPWYELASTSGGGGVSASYTGTGQDIYNRAYGMFAIGTGPLVNNYVGLVTTGSILIAGLGSLDIYFRFSIGRLPTVTDNWMLQLGLTDAGAVSTNASVLIMTFNISPAAPTWYGENVRAGATVDTTPTISPTIQVISSNSFSMYNARISINEDWSSASFFVNNVQIGAAIGGLPAAGIMLTPYIFARKMAGNTLQGLVYIDDVFIDYHYVTP